MDYIIGAQTDVGIKKKTNQDSYGFRLAETSKHGKILFAVLCDGMGGLSSGEKASGSVINDFMNWFEDSFANYLKTVDIDFEFLKSEWENLILRCNQKIAAWGRERGISLGTTLVVTLCMDGKLYVANVGDSRVYKFSDRAYRMTHDHSLVAQEIANGNLSPEQEETDPRRNVLLQCIGASKSIVPEIVEYDLEPDTLYMLCCDGFRHEIREDEMFSHLSPALINDEEKLVTTLRDIIELLKIRKENDNITAVAFKTTA